jgi:uncharacterized glyoxalase superfamily protein PhnB
MPDPSLAERLDAAVETILARAASATIPADAALRGLWRLAVDLLDLPSEGFRARLRDDIVRRARSMSETASVPYIREGLRSITPYLVVEDAARLLAFLEQAFDARELLRLKRPDGTIQHAEVRIGDSVVELGQAQPPWKPMPAAIHLYVEDADAVYERASRAGARTLVAPTDMPYGDREADVKDPAGNNWYIGTHREGGPLPPGLFSITPVLHPRGADRLIDFMKAAFEAEEVERFAPEGIVLHAKIRLGESIVELGEAHGPFGPMPATIHYYVPDTDAAYRQALRAGATSLREPEDTPYGDRSAAVSDPFGNRWFLATRLTR